MFNLKNQITVYLIQVEPLQFEESSKSKNLSHQNFLSNSRMENLII